LGGVATAAIADAMEVVGVAHAGATVHGFPRRVHRERERERKQCEFAWTLCAALEGLVRSALWPAAMVLLSMRG
jgi:hypothetical protein